jgi:serine/threonine protein kinase
MGRVYLGESPSGRMVAVKLIRSELADNPDFRRRFTQEVAAAKCVSGIFTAPVVDADPEGPQPWLVTAYVSGPSLADAVASYGPLPVESVRTLAAGLAEGLGTVHAAGIVHRDLKPSNVLLSIDGPRIIDFGISRAADATWLSRAGRVVGSPGFMSPEQAEGREVGPAADIFSLGSVLAFAASGRPPFGSGSASTLLHRVVYGSAALGHVPAGLRPMIERCLLKDPAARPSTEQLLAELSGAEPAEDWLSRHLLMLRAPALRHVGADGGRAQRSLYRDHDTPADRTRPARAARPWPGRLPSPWPGRLPSPWPDRPLSVSPDRLLGAWPGASPSRSPSRALPSPRKNRAAMAGWAAAVVLAGGAASAGAAVAAGSHHQPTHPAGALPLPHTDQRKHVVAPPPPGARSVVLAYFAAINARDWPMVWHLGGDRLSPSYSSMVAGYAKTIRDDVKSIRVSGDQVLVRIRAYEVDGVTQIYRVEYTVRNAAITSGRLLAT